MCRICMKFTLLVKYLQFFDSTSEVELRISLGGRNIQSSRDIFVDATEKSLIIRVKNSGSLITLVETDKLYDKVKPAETIWWVVTKQKNLDECCWSPYLLMMMGICILNRFMDDDQLVVNLKKQDPELKWPDIVESWDSLITGSTRLLKGASIYIIGDSTEINQKVGRELAVGIG